VIGLLPIGELAKHQDYIKEHKLFVSLTKESPIIPIQKKQSKLADKELAHANKN
jgi:hypothetical protein